MRLQSFLHAGLQSTWVFLYPTGNQVTKPNDYRNEGALECSMIGCADRMRGLWSQHRTLDTCYFTYTSQRTRDQSVESSRKDMLFLNGVSKRLNGNCNSLHGSLLCRTRTVRWGYGTVCSAQDVGLPSPQSQIIHVPGNIVPPVIDAVVVETHIVAGIPTIEIKDEGMLFPSQGERSSPEADAFLVTSIVMILFLIVYL